jgi:hypothetical protein
MAQRVSLAGPQSDVQGRMATATLGTGTLTLGAAASGATTFAAMPLPINDGDAVTYELIDIGASPTAKEKGRGTYHAAGPTLSRDTVIWSTNGGARLNLSGNGYVFVTADESDYLLTGNARKLLTAATTYYIATNGNDANDGLTSGTPWATLAHAKSVLSGQIDFGGQQVTLQAVAGHANFTEQLNLFPWAGGGSLTYDGGGGSLSVTNNPAVACSVPLPGNVTLANVTISASGSLNNPNGITHSGKGNIIIGPGVNFAACAGYHMNCANTGATILFGANYTISGDANFHMAAYFGGVFWANADANSPLGFTVSITGARTFAVAFASAQANGVLFMRGMQYQATGGGAPSVTGTRYIVATNGTIWTLGAVFPGTVAGTNDGTGVYQ